MAVQFYPFKTYVMLLFNLLIFATVAWAFIEVYAFGTAHDERNESIYQLKTIVRGQECPRYEDNE